MAPPDFTNRTLFPPFDDLPEVVNSHDPHPNFATAYPNPSSTTARDEGTTPTPTLIAQIKEDMTITKPTLILTDRDCVPFALVFEGYDREEGIQFLKSKGLKKGVTVVLKDGLAKKVAPRGDSKSGKASVRIERGSEHEVGVIAGKMDRVFEIVERFRGAEEASREYETAGAVNDTEKGEGQGERTEEGKGRCDACGETGGGRDGSLGLFKCTGCGVARYCSKDCQVKGWTGGGHKADCKVIKGIITIWGR